MSKQLSLFEKDRATSQDAIALTIQSLKAYGQDYKHWQISFSGGKDSSCLVTLVIHLIETGEIPKPDTLTVMYADTRQELPPLHASAMQILREVSRRGFTSQVVTAPIDKRFWVYILGRGVPPPNNSTLRWCTQQIKLNPMVESIKELHSHVNQRFLSLNGVRIGESAIRDRRILTSCSKNGGECGQGWFQRDLPDALCDKLAPILHWRVCSVWDWLMVDAPRIGFETEILADVYGGDEATELDARTGCIGCPLTDKDTALINLVKKYPQWEYLTPLLEIKKWHRWAREYQNRLQKYGETNKDGCYSSNPCRKGPLTLDARKRMLDEILSIQSRCNDNRGEMPQVDIINDEEELRICELIEAGTFPNKWTGDEANGADLLPTIYQDGSKQLTIFQ